jgi:hypothetical protein
VQELTHEQTLLNLDFLQSACQEQSRLKGRKLGVSEAPQVSRALGFSFAFARV